MGGTISATNPTTPTLTQPCVFTVLASGVGVEISSVSISALFPGMNSPEVVYSSGTFTGEYDGYSNTWGSVTSKGFSVLRQNGWRYGTPRFNIQVVYSNGSILNSTGGGAILEGGVGGVTPAGMDEAFVTYVLNGAGLPLKMDKTTYLGSGTSDVYHSLTLPSLLTLLDNAKYCVSGTLLVKNGSTLLATIELRNQVLRYTTGPAWTSVRAGGYELTKETGWDTYFVADEDFPIFGESSGILSFVCKPIDAQSVTVEFDGVIAAHGTDA